VKRLKLVPTLLAAVGVLLTGLCARAQAPANQPEVVGKVMAIRGKVEAVDAAGATRRLKLKSPIFLGDALKTSSRGRVQVAFRDNTQISLGRNTEMVIEDYQFKPEESVAAMVTNVKSGVFRVMGGAITKIAPEKFMTKTPTATIGIRGSFYMGRLFSVSLEVVFLGGIGITVGNTGGMVAITKPCHGTIVPGRGMAPYAARRYASRELRGFMKNFEDARGPGARVPEDADAEGRRRRARRLEDERKHRRLEDDQRYHEKALQDEQNKMLKDLVAWKPPDGPQPDPPDPGTKWDVFTIDTAGAAQKLADVDSAAFLQDHPAGAKMATAADWGYWQAAVRAQAGYWVGGEITPRSHVQSLIHTSGFTGVYTGGARCLRMGLGRSPEELVGDSRFRVFFDARSMNGTMTFPRLSISAIGVIDPEGAGFTGSITSVSDQQTRETISSSSLQGDFFGTNAKSLGGTFNADTSAASYIGVFAGDKE